MARATRIKRRLFRLVILILTLALVGIIAGGAFLWLRYNSRQAQATGYFKTKPVLQADFQAAAYHVNSFIPLLGQQNLVEPVSYGDYRVAAGVTGSGSAVIMQQAEDGTSAWSVDLGAPLVACSQQAIGDSEEENRFLPCLYQSGNGSGVALVDLKMGTANWIWESADPYVNIGTTDSQIVLVGEDLSLLRISQTGEQLSEGLMSQKSSDTQLQPDLTACSLDDQPTEQAPEKFELFSDSLWIIGHNGINYLINPETNQIQVASPGRLIRNADDTAWALSTDDGCVRSFYIQPQRTHIAPLPKGTTVPTDNTGHLLNMVQKGGKLFQMDWETSRSLRAVFTESDFKLGSETQILPTKKFLYIASGGQLGCYSRQDGKRLWEFSENPDTLRLHQDILLYTTDQGELKAVSSADGITLWSLTDSAGIKFPPIRDDKQLHSFSPQSFKTWGQQNDENQGVAKGAANLMNKAKPGLNFPVDSCIRVRDVSGSGSSYQVQFDRVSCKLKGAEKVIRVIDTGEVERGKPAKDYMDKCLDDPAATSAITVTSAIADPKISALCTGKAENAEKEPNQRGGQPRTGTTQVSER